jgi:hypothetical protein
MDKDTESKIAALADMIEQDVATFLVMDLCSPEHLNLLEKNQARTAPLKHEVGRLLHLPVKAMSAAFLQAVVTHCEQAGSDAAKGIKAVLREAAEMERYLP